MGADQRRSQAVLRYARRSGEWARGDPENDSAGARLYSRRDWSAGRPM